MINIEMEHMESNVSCSSSTTAARTRDLEIALKITGLLAATFLMMVVAFGAAVRFETAANFYLGRYGVLKPGSDVTLAMAKAWKDVCASARPSVLVIPKQTYILRKGYFKGPCKSPIEIRLLGTLQAPLNSIGDDSWVTFAYIDKLTLSGGGVFDGQRKAALVDHGCLKGEKNCEKLPISLRFNFISNSVVREISSHDSKSFHMNVYGCKNMTFQGVKIIAPQNNTNTNGIHIARSKGITITKSQIATGDDCISLGDGSKQISISNVTCGPGHGISIGSLGKYSIEESVEGVVVKNCTFTNTMNGVRIKTMPASPTASIATNIHFKDIVMINVSNPILIDQEYCPWNECNRQIPSKVKIKKVSFTNIRGSSATPVAVKMVCSKGRPCDGVKVKNIDLSYNGKEGSITSQCSNVKPIIFGKQSPKICSSPYVVP